jgi:hypothetical protein
LEAAFLAAAAAFFLAAAIARFDFAMVKKWCRVGTEGKDRSKNVVVSKNEGAERSKKKKVFGVGLCVHPFQVRRLAKLGLN